MPSSPQDRLSVIQQNYSDALDDEADDLAQATTPALVAQIQSNVASARAAYYSAAADTLANSSALVETAYASAQAALKAVKDARTASAAIPELISKLNSSTSAATNLLNAAKSAPKV